MGIAGDEVPGMPCVILRAAADSGCPSGGLGRWAWGPLARVAASLRGEVGVMAVILVAVSVASAASWWDGAFGWLEMSC